MALRATQAVLEVLLDQDSSVRVTQGVLEVALTQTSSVRVTQAVLEVLEGPNPGETFTGTLTLTGPAPSLGFTIPIPAGALIIEPHGVPYDNFVYEPGTGALLLSGLAPKISGTEEIPVGALAFSGLTPTSLWVTRGDISQLAVEYSENTSVAVNVSQLVVEFAPTAPPATVAVSQLIVEVLRYFVEPPCPTVHPEGCPAEFPPQPAAGPAGCSTSFGLEGTRSS